MKEKAVLFAVFLVASMLAMTIAPARAWVYWDTGPDPIWQEKSDMLMEAFGPRADKVQINFYSTAAAEFAALAMGQIDLTDWPLDCTNYVAFTTPPLNAQIAVVDTGAAFDMFNLDMRMDPRQYLDPPSNTMPNPAWQAALGGNPTAEKWLRRAIATCIDRPTQVWFPPVSLPPIPPDPLQGSELYTPLSPAYGPWANTAISPVGVLSPLTHVTPVNGAPNVALGLAYLAAHGYAVGASGFQEYNGRPFHLDFYVNSGCAARWAFATARLLPLLTAATPTGLQLDVRVIPVTSAGARQYVMAAKMGHLYTGGWTLAPDPDHLYYLYNIDNYWHPGRPPNYMYYPGDADKYTVTTDGWAYDGFPATYDWTLPPWGISLADARGKTWNAGDVVWMNPVNYWSWELMTATNWADARAAAWRLQEALAWYVCGEPVWCSRTFSAFYRTYTGPELPYSGHPWKCVVDQIGLGTWGTMSHYDMHTDNALWGNGITPMVIRWGFSQPFMSLNPLYAEWVWDWQAMNLCYDTVIKSDPYTLADMQNLADSWTVSTWNSPDYGTCSKITFNMRHDLRWSDGVPLTASDVKFSWGGPLVTGSISNLLAAGGYPPPYWSTKIADIISIYTPDPFTVIVYMDTYSYFSLRSPSGWNIVLPEHIWKPVIQTGNPTNPWNQPSVCSGPYILTSTADPTLSGLVIVLNKNPLHNMLQLGSNPLKPFPMTVWTAQSSNAREVYGNTHYMYPRLGDTNVNLAVTVNLHNWYVYETGPYQANVYPDTRLDGTIVVDLFKWTMNGLPSDDTNYVFDRPIDPGSAWNARRCQTSSFTYNIDGLPCGWYFIRVTITINSLEYSTDGGTTWIPVPSPLNPFYGDMKVYKEYALVTSRYDICGTFWKIVGAAYYQPVSDLAVEVGDVFACAMAYGTSPGYARWNPACDINNDYQVDVADFYRIAMSYGWTDP